jgi:hypothetical protein
MITSIGSLPDGNGPSFAQRANNVKQSLKKKRRRPWFSGKALDFF